MVNLGEEIEIALGMPCGQVIRARMTERRRTEMRNIVEIGFTLTKVAGTPMSFVRQAGIARGQNLMAQCSKCLSCPPLLEGRQGDECAVTAGAYHAPYLLFIKASACQTGARYDRVRPFCGGWCLCFSHKRNSLRRTQS